MTLSLLRSISVFLLLGTVVWAAPHVVSTTPEHMAMGVDPKLRQVVVTFDQPMNRSGMSVVGDERTMPRIGRTRWANQRTFVLPVLLEPDRMYRIGFNDDRYQNFKSEQGESAEPFVLEFRTGAKRERNTREAAVYTAEQQQTAVELMREAMAVRYSHYERFMIDWPGEIDAMSGALVRERTPQRFAMLAAQILKQAQDKHLFLEVEGERISTHVAPVNPNIDESWIRAAARDWQEPNPYLAFATLRGGVPYALVRTWGAQTEDAYEPLFAFVGRHVDEPGLIIDVRLNGGGSEKIARQFAGCFVDEQMLYAKHVYRDEGLPLGFTDPIERRVEPNFARPRYRGHVAVLSGPAVMSSAEAFLLMMRQAPRATIFGETSQGSSGNPVPYDLGNDVMLYVPSWKAMTPFGDEFEGYGIDPDVEVPWEAPGLLTPDPVLEAAIRHIEDL